MTTDQQKQLLEVTFHDIPKEFVKCQSKLAGTDKRLCDYISAVVKEGQTLHNLYEVLAIKKFLRLMQKYEWRTEEVKKFIRLYESIKFNGIDGRRTYKLTPIQVFQFASIYGFYRDDGTRLCREAILFVPRKFGKTTSVASIAVNDLLYGDANGQAYMASNSQDQANICYSETKKIIEQLDPDGNSFRITAGETNWKTPNEWNKESKIARLTAGAKTKDGLNASVVIYDEYMSASYVKDHSDGAQLLQVLTSSMGTRRQPLTVIISTASRVIGSPGETLLNGAKEALERDDEKYDYQFLSCFQPQPWMTEEDYGKEETWRMCQPHMGITIQPNFYKEEWVKAQQDPEKYKEFLTKYLNIFQTDKVVDWFKPEQIKRIQINMKIDDCSESKDWVTFAAGDFSNGDDLCGISYLAFNQRTGEFFADMDAWINENSLHHHANSQLYKTWVEQGWLRVSPGATINEHLVTSRLIEVSKRTNLLRFGYDSYDAKRFVNDFGAYIFSMGLEPSQYLIPVSQTYATYNSPVQELTYMVKTEPPLLYLSNNPIWNWEFANVCLDYEPRMGNCKPIKRTSSSNGKVDNIQALASCVYIYDSMQGAQSK